MIAVPALVANAREWVGVPFLHQGRTRLGCDCLGFIAGCLNELGSSTLLDNLPRAYGRDPQAQLMAGLENLTRKLDLEPGVIVLIQFPQAQFPSHAGFYTGESIIHAYQASEKVVEHGYRIPWTSRTAARFAAPLVMYR